MKRVDRFFVAVCILVLLNGCKEVPSEVKNGTYEINTSSEAIQNETQEKFDTLENIYQNLDSVLSKRYDNLIINKNIEINNPEKVYKLNCVQQSDYTKQKEDLLNYFVADLDKKYLDPRDGTSEYENTKTGECLSMSDNGFFFYARKENSHIIDITNEVNGAELNETIYFKEQYENKNYSSNGYENDINSLRKKADEYAEEVCAKFDTLKWTSDSVSIYNDEKGEIYFRFRFNKSYNDTYMFYSDYRRNIDEMKDLYVCVMQPDMFLNIQGEMLSVTDFPGIVNYSVDKEYDKVVSLGYGLNELSKLLSSYKTYKVHWISLEYRLSLVEGKKVEEDSFMYSNWDEENKYVAKPCWTVYFNTDPQNPQFAMIDCETGDIEVAFGR